MPCPLSTEPIPILFEDLVRVFLLPEEQPIICKTGSMICRHQDLVVVETHDGEFLGRVSRFLPPVLRRPARRPARITRLAEQAEIDMAADFEEVALNIRKYIRRQAHELDLEMQPVRVSFPLAGEPILVYFTAEHRVDFRPLLKDLNRRYQKRIEMRPLGVRDGAKAVGALGPCGRELCCSGFMDRFHSVTVRMVKRQNLSLNPAKISGMCGRLMCCLAHEVEQYPELKKRRRQKQGP